MIIAYAFIGKLPSYAIDTVHQTRLFTKDDIYFITNDSDSDIAKTLSSKYNVKIIPYDEVQHHDFSSIIDIHYSRFCIVDGLKERKNLFIYAFERFFVLLNLMLKYNLSNVFFMEVDNLIYDNPSNWQAQFSKKPMAFMYDNANRCASGICYIQTSDMLAKFCNFCLNYILFHQGFLEEMGALYSFWTENRDEIHLLPIHWEDPSVPNEVKERYDEYNSIFDAAALGIYLGGMDPYHTNGQIVKGLQGKWSLLDYTNYKFKWEHDTESRSIPYVFSGSKWVKINNLHIHSKELGPCLSK